MIGDMTMNTTTSTIQLQQPGRFCVTAQHRFLRKALLLALCIIFCITCIGVSYAVFQPTALVHPDFDSSAVAGTPEVGKDAGYSTLKVQDGYHVSLCGKPQISGDDVFFFITNPVSNDVWFRVEVLDKAGKILGETGVLKQDQHLPSIRLMLPENQKEIPVTIRVISYAPNTWQSCGNVSLQMVLSMN